MIRLDIRPLDWATDAMALASLSTSWTADRIFAVERGEWSFELREQPLGFSYDKDGQPIDLDSLRSAEAVLVANRDREVIGVCGLYLSEWNLRPSIGNPRVAPLHRRAGVGRALVLATIDRARATGARGLWLEVTSVNVAAIHLYRSVGFRLCGLDEALYMRWGLGGETALFMLYEFNG